VTEADGGFLIAGISREALEAAHGRVEVVVEGRTDPVLETADGDLPWTLRSAAGRTVDGVVLDGATGEPVGGATVLSDHGHETRSDPAGAFRLAGVEAALWAWAPGYAPESIELGEAPSTLGERDGDDELQGTDDADDADDADSADAMEGAGKTEGADEADDADDAEETVGAVVLRLVRGLAIEGVVKDRRGRPLPGVRVAIAEGQLLLDVDPERAERRLRGDLLAAVTGAAGRYRIEGIRPDLLAAPEALEIELRPEGAAGGVLREVPLAAAELASARGGAEGAGRALRRDFVLDLSPVVRGGIVQADGSPLERARLIVEAAGDTLWRVDTTDARGAFALRSLTAGDYTLVAEAEGRAVLVTRFTAPAPAPLALRVEPPRRVDGLVLSARDLAPVAGLAVVLRLTRGPRGVHLETRTLEGGEFAFTAVPPGIHTLEARRPPPSTPYDPHPPSYAVSVDASAADASARIEYPEHPSGDLVLRFFRARGGDPAAPPAPLERLVERSVEVRVVRYAGPEIVRGVEKGGAGFKIGEGRGEFRARLLAGDYTLRATAVFENERWQEMLEIRIEDGELKERDVVFAPR
jgi:protocatechuate 3,4-dioxygenase beta subunit